MLDRELDWNEEISEEGGSFEPLPAGNYEFTVAKVERARSKGQGKLPPCNMAKVTFNVFGADNEKREIIVNFVLHSSLEWKLSQLFLSVAMKRHGEPLKMNWSAIVGKSGKCEVIIRPYQKKDGSTAQTNDIKYFYAYDEDVQVVSANQNLSQNYAQPTYNANNVNPYYAAPQQQPVQSTNNKWTAGSF